MRGKAGAERFSTEKKYVKATEIVRLSSPLRRFRARGEARSKDSLLNAVGKVVEILFETVRSLNLFQGVVNRKPPNLRKQNSRPQRRLFSGDRPFEFNYTAHRSSVGPRSVLRNVVYSVSFAQHICNSKENAMPDQVTRKRLKQKALERWENEGGKIETERKRTIKHNPTKESAKGPGPPSQLRRTEKRKSR